MERIGEAEYAVMEVLWQEAPLTAAEVAERVPAERGWSIRTVKTMLGRLLREIEDDKHLVMELYLRVLARQPSDKELQTCLAYRRDIRDRGEAFEDILWSLVNSTEFLHRK